MAGSPGPSCEDSSRVASVPARVVVPAESRFLFLEHIDYSPEHDDADMRGYHAMERRSAGRFRTWRDDADRLASLDHMGVNDVAFHRATGLTAACGYVAPDWYADKSLHPSNSGAEDWEHLWIRRGGDRFVRADVRGTPWAVDISADGSRIAGLWWMKPGALCAVIDAATLEPCMLTAVKHAGGGDLSGGEELRFSPDGSWLLFTSPIEDGAVSLLEAETGRLVSVPCPEVRTAAWWPQRSPSSLLVGWLDDIGYTSLGALDLSDGSCENLGSLDLPRGMRDDAQYPGGLERLSLGPDGQSLVGLTRLAPDAAWAMPQRPRWRVARGTLTSTGGVITDVSPAFIDRLGASAIEHTRPRWLDLRQGPPPEVGAPFRTTAVGATLD